MRGNINNRVEDVMSLIGHRLGQRYSHLLGRSTPYPALGRQKSSGGCRDVRLSANVLAILLIGAYVDLRTLQKSVDITIPHHSPTKPKFPDPT